MERFPLPLVIGLWLLATFTVIVVFAPMVGASECLQAGDHCRTVEDYDQAYEDPYASFDAMEYLFGVPSEPLASFPSEPQKRPSERLLGYGLVETLFTFAELIEQREEAFDNPAFR